MMRVFCLFVVALSTVSCLAAAADHNLENQMTANDQVRNFLWRATGPTGTQVFLLGSIHALPDDAYPLPVAINDAFDRAKTVVFEVDLQDTEVLGGRMMAAGSLPADTHLEDILDPDTRRLLDAHLEKSDLSLSAFETMRPWMMALSLTSIELMKAGFTADAGLDLHFARRASQEGKRVEALESVDYQIGLFSSMDEDESLAFLRYTLKDIDNVVPQIGDLTQAWKSGDVATLSILLTEAFADEPVLFDRMVTRRNRAWLPRVEGLLSGDDSAMIVVGALHLVGPEGLIELLREQGYRVDQL